MKAIIALEDGTVFNGISAGTEGERIGDVVLNTAVVGYQEMATDPANAGKILVLTYPLIGNYGVAKKFYESEKCHIGGLVIKESSRTYSNWQAEDSFGNFLKNEGVVCISEADTRTLAVHIRDNGEMLGAISTEGLKAEGLLKKVKDYKKAKAPGRIEEVSTKVVRETGGKRGGPRIGILDLGVTNSLLKQLASLGCSVSILPYNTPSNEILGMKFDGFIVSGGPENDPVAADMSETVKGLIGKIPVMGIAAGHEIIGLALGGRLKRMKIGHRGVNYPVKSDDSYKAEITVQNHSYVIDEGSIKNLKDIKVAARNINDGTIEELSSERRKLISVQYCPSSPGFDETNPVIMKFLKMIPAQRRMNRSRKACEAEYAKA